MDDGEQTETGCYPIPPELLIQLPIAEVDADTRIIHLTKAIPVKYVAVVQGGTTEPQAGPSDIKEMARVKVKAQDTSNMCEPLSSNIVPEERSVAFKPNMNTTAQNNPAPYPTITVAIPKGTVSNANPPKQQDVTGKEPNVPKKGYITTNRKALPVDPTPQENDYIVQKRLQVLSEKFEIVKKSEEKRSMTAL